MSEQISAGTRARDIEGSSLTAESGEASRLSVRANVTLATYWQLAELARTNGVTIEGAAGVVIAHAFERENRISARRSRDDAARVDSALTCDSLRGPRGAGWGTKSTPGENLDGAALEHPAANSLRTGASLVRPAEGEVSRD